jgi:adenylate cyclase
MAIDPAPGGARNVEIKARVADRAAVESRAAALADRGPFDLAQDDTFFACANGRLKLRELASDRGELIHYERPDLGGPKLSNYVIAKTSEPAALREALSRAWGVGGRVCKQRRLYLLGRTRIHLDRVEGLGDFLELEVVLEPSQSVAEGEAEARRIMAALGVTAGDLVSDAYVDLLAAHRR